MPAVGFRLDQSILSIRKLADDSRSLQVLPSGSHILVSSAPDEEGLTAVSCRGEVYYVFEEDLNARAQKVIVDARIPAGTELRQRSFWSRHAG